MKEKWQSLNQREQHLVLVMAVVIVIFVLYLLIWRPLNNSISTQQYNIAKQEELLIWINEKQAEYQLAQNFNQSKNSNNSLSSVINSTSARNKIVISRIQPQGDEILVTIDEIAFNSLMDWLKEMSVAEGVIIKAIDLARTDTKGVVKVRRLNLGRS